MNKLNFLLFSIILTITSNLWGYSPPAAPTDGFLLDQANILSESEKAEIRQKLKNIEQTTQNEIAVLTLTSLDGASIEDVAYTTFNTWKIGKKERSNGVLLVVAIQDRKMRIETGKGVGGELTDLQSKRILDKMKPAFKEQKYAQGILVGINGITQHLDKRIDPSKETSENTTPWGTIIFLGLVFIVTCFISWLMMRREKKMNSFLTSSTYGSSLRSSYSYSDTPSYSRRSSKSSSSSSTSSGFFSSGSSSSSGDYSSSSSSSSFGGGDSGGGGSSDSW